MADWIEGNLDKPGACPTLDRWTAHRAPLADRKGHQLPTVACFGNERDLTSGLLDFRLLDYLFLMSATASARTASPRPRASIPSPVLAFTLTWAASRPSA